MLPESRTVRRLRHGFCVHGAGCAQVLCTDDIACMQHTTASEHAVLVQGDGQFKTTGSTQLQSCGGLVAASPVYMQGALPTRTNTRTRAAHTAPCRLDLTNATTARACPALIPSPDSPAWQLLAVLLPPGGVPGIPPA